MKFESFILKFLSAYSEIFKLNYLTINIAKLRHLNFQCKIHVKSLLYTILNYKYKFIYITNFPFLISNVILQLLISIPF